MPILQRVVASAVVVVLAAACDLRVAAADARFSIPEVAIGIPLAWGGIPRLVREIGPALAKELVMTCRRPIDAGSISMSHGSSIFGLVSS